MFDRKGSLIDSVYAADTSEDVSASGGAASRKDTRVHLTWNYTGDLLAIANNGGSTVTLWRARTREVQSLESNMKGISCLRWNSTAPVLAIGTNKGNLMFYNALLGKKVPMIGRHTDSILHAQWTRNNILGTTSADKKLSLSKGVDGDGTVYEIPLQYRSTKMSFSDAHSVTSGQKGANATGGNGKPKRANEERDVVASTPAAPSPGSDGDRRASLKASLGEERLMLAISGSRVLYVVDMSDFSSSKSPFELSFQDFYGDVKAFEWFGDKQLLVAFSKGYIVVLSSHTSEVGEEFHSKRYFKDRLEDIAFCPGIGMLAAVGGNVIKLLDVYSSDFKDIVTDVMELPSNLVTTKAGWTADGQVLAVATETGDIFGVLASLPFVTCSYAGMLVHLTSLQEISVVNVLSDGSSGGGGGGAGVRGARGASRSKAQDRVTIEIDTEPSFVGVGVSHIAVGVYNEVWFYKIDGKTMNDGGGRAEQESSRSSGKGDRASRLVFKKEYMGSVTEIHLNARFAAALIDRKLHVHEIEPTSSSGNHRSHSASHDSSEYIIPSEKDDSAGGSSHATADITSVAISDQLLFYGTEQGNLHVVHLETQARINDFTHLEGGGGRIAKIVPNGPGTRLLFLDARDEVYLYNPVNHQLLNVFSVAASAGNATYGPLHPKQSAKEAAQAKRNVRARVQAPNGMLWDLLNANCFIVFDGEWCDVYKYAATTVSGPQVFLLESAQLQHGTPVILHNGRITSQLRDGTIESFVLPSHSTLQDENELILGTAAASASSQTMPGTPYSPGKQSAIPASKMMKAVECFGQRLRLGRLWEAWQLCLLIRQASCYEDLAFTALEQLELPLAEKCFRLLGNAGMTMSIASIRHIEEISLLCGHVLVLLERDYDRAQEYFLASSVPCEALRMRKDLKHWEEALRLSESLAPSQVSEIALEYAATLEMQGEAARALACYERSLADPLRDTTRDAQCKEGIARVSLMMGDVRRGRRLSVELNTKSSFRDSAAILEGMRQLPEAAEMYMRAEQYEKAAELYIASKNYAAAEPLLCRKELESSRLHGHLARAHEAEGRFKEAAAAYRRARDVDNEVRLYLQQLDAPEKAFALVRDSRAVGAADVVASYCKASGNMRVAIEFLIIAKKNDEAFDIACAHEEVDHYASLITADGRGVGKAAGGSVATAEDLMRTARYYESRGQSLEAGKMYSLSKMHGDALRMFLNGGSGEEGIELALKVVGEAKSDKLTHALIEHLTSGAGGAATAEKSNDYLFRVHLALGNYEAAAKMAFLIARSEQEMGNYKVAHEYLLKTLLELRKHGIIPSSEYSKSLLLLHSYTLVRGKVREGQHAVAARLLVRVAKNISKFPAHVVPILTSTVIECQRASMKKTAYEYACVLMRPEYRNNITADYKRKIENIVRKNAGAAATSRTQNGTATGGSDSTATPTEDPEDVSSCPFCGTAGSVADLECTKCMNVIPYCIVTGMRMRLGDWTQCPRCEFPATQTAMLQYVQTNGSCPMCSHALNAADISSVTSSGPSGKGSERAHSGGDV